MTFRRHVAPALQSLWEHRLRAALSMIGVMVGGLVILLLVSIATGVKADVAGQVESIGVNVLIVIPGRIEEGTFSPNMAGMSYLREEDASRLARVPGVKSTAPWTFVGGGIRRKQKSAPAILVATTPDWFRMHPLELQEGSEFRKPENVCVIGSLAKEGLFGTGKAVGENVQINGKPYRVIGVTKEKKGSSSLFSMGSFQNLVYIPYSYLKKQEPAMQTDRIMIQIDPEAEPKQLIKSLEATLGERLDRQQYQVLTQEDLLGLVFKLMGILTWLLTGLTSIALFVGGLGIMTVMLMSVNERVTEIGIRKAVGATRSDIFLQFLAEAVILAMIAGLLALGSSLGINLALREFTPIKPIMTWQIVTLAMGVCLGLGSTFGVLPAATAAKKDPVQCLRNSG
jgi:putative ABC transport system permease protein